MGWQVFMYISMLSVGVARGQVSYSIPEEMEKGAVIGNIAQDLGLGVDRLKSGKARIYTGNTEEYVELRRDRGVLLIKDRIDRESLCGQTMPCALHFQMILENPMEFYTVTVEITDINDNPPTFERSEMKYEISESALTGARFVLEKAVDNDVGVNGLSSYTLKPSDNFVLKTISRGDGTKHVEMVLQKPLDREKHEHLSLILTALDGGEPQLSGTMQIMITVLDANDNPPVCSRTEYKASVTENAPVGTVVTTVRATDVDKGNNGKVTYMIPKSAAASLFQIDPNDGVLTLTGNVDYEKRRLYELDVQVSDQGGLSDACKVIVDVTDTNDNPPSINIMSKSNTLSENMKPGTVVTMLNIQDPDSNENGKVMCVLSENTPFTIKSTTNNFFSVLTEDELDRERASEYNISVTCSDEGVPSLSSSVTLT
ncbi:protocadherin beta-1-like, partial [Stegastes partitus]|uniref:Protocadherin beta-1-like n=1 Tax=Stegastes partitus TaxID=144197 RepID=A0A9Y4NV33_9TELE